MMVEKVQIIAFLAFSIITISAVSYAHGEKVMAVPVIPNEGVITGKVLSYALVSSELLSMERKSPYETQKSPATVLYELRILIEKTENVERKKNFTQDKVGKVVAVYTKTNLSPDLLNQRVKVKISLKGDEWGTNFWMRGDVELVSD